MPTVRLLVVLLVVAACGTGPGPATGGPETTTPGAGGVEPPDWFVDQGAMPGDLAGQLAANLAQQLDADPDQVFLRGSMHVQWRNSGLGCAQPAETVLQVITPGYLAYFDVDGDTHAAHVADDGRHRFCEQAGEPDVVPVR